LAWVTPAWRTGSQGYWKGGDALQPVPRRERQQVCGLVRPAGRGRGGRAGAERLVDHQHGRAVQVVRQHDRPFDLGYQTALANAAGTRAAARALGQDHAQTQRRDRGGVSPACGCALRQR